MSGNVGNVLPSPFGIALFKASFQTNFPLISSHAKWHMAVYRSARIANPRQPRFEGTANEVFEQQYLLYLKNRDPIVLRR